MESISPKAEKTVCKSLAVVLGDRFPTSSVVTGIPPLPGVLQHWDIDAPASDAPYRGLWAMAGGSSLVAAANRRSLGEALPAVHRPVSPRFERDLGALAALGTDNRVHLARGRAVTAAVTALAPL